MQQKEITIEYDLTDGEMRQALKIFDRRTKFKKRMILTLLLLFIAAYNIVDLFVFRVDSNMPAFLAMAAMALIAIMWYNLRREHNAYAAAVENMKFRMKIDNEGINAECRMQNAECRDELRSSDPRSSESDETDGTAAEEWGNDSKSFKFAEDNIEIVANDQLYLIFIGKEWMYAIPRRCTDGQLTMYD
ncbi:MAG: hypothetical protein FWH14_07010 [Oscillospiraceae bacterium]|nr:hypothetical protein [Oscillospiraceae bacterium]